MRFGPKYLKISFTGSRPTHYGGVYLVHSFFKNNSYQNITIKQSKISSTKQQIHNFRRNPGIILGIQRIENTKLLQHNGVFQHLTGLLSYPNPTMLRRILLEMAPIALPKLRGLHDQLLFAIYQKTQRHELVIFDIDSTVLTLHGKQ